MGLSIEIFYSIVGISILVLLIVYCKMKPGFGKYNLKVLGLILITIFSSLLAFKGNESLQAAFGILGVIAGYLFGSSGEDTIVNSNGDGNQIAMRDINNKIEGLIQNYESSLNKFSQCSYLIHYQYSGIYNKQNDVCDIIEEVVSKRISEGYELVSLSSEKLERDHVVFVFRKNDGMSHVKVTKD